MPVSRPLFERFNEKFEEDAASGCWLWTAYVHPNGYGSIKSGPQERVNLGAHRAAWQLYRGPIPAGMWVCHKCDVRNCVNPDHLFLDTHQGNMDDMKKKGRGRGATGTDSHQGRKTHCQRGHPYSGSNLYVRPDGAGRGCMQCRRMSDQRRRREERQAQNGAV